MFVYVRLITSISNKHATKILIKFQLAFFNRRDVTVLKNKPGFVVVKLILVQLHENPAVDKND